MGPAFVNGSPFFYYDSAGYIEGVAKAVRAIFFESRARGITAEEQFGAISGDNVVQGGRSIYYGALAFLGWKTTIWLPVFVQCLALSWLIVMHVQRLSGNVWPRVSVAILALLALGTPAAIFAGLIMPDVWAGVGILALALLWSDGSRSSRGTRAAIFAILAFATLSHGSHLALFAILTAGGALAQPFLAHGLRLRRSVFAIPALAVLAGLAGQLAYSTAVRTTFGEPPLSRPFIAAHLVDMGPGTRFLQKNCPESDYALCKYADRLPVSWTSFLFSTSETRGVYAAADPETQRAIVREQIPLLRDTLAAEPGATVGGFVTDGIRQLWTLSVEDVPITRRTEGFLTRNFPEDLVLLIKSSVIYDAPGWLTFVTRMTEAVTAASVAALLLWASLPSDRGRMETARRLNTVVAVTVAGVLGERGDLRRAGFALRTVPGSSGVAAAASRSSDRRGTPSSYDKAGKLTTGGQGIRA